MKMRMRKSHLLTVVAVFILAVCMTIPAANIAPAYAEEPVSDYGVYVKEITKIHIKNDGLSHSEILKYEARFYQAFATLVIENRSNGLRTYTFNTQKITFEGKEVYISGIDVYVETENTNPVTKSMNPGRGQDGCPVSFYYTFDLSEMTILDTLDISVKSVDGSFEKVLSLNYETKTISFTPEPTPDPEPTPEPTPTPTPEPTPTLTKVSGIPLTTMTASGETAMTIAWQKVTGADGYDIFFSRCNYNGKKVSTRNVKTIEGNSTFVWTNSGLKAGTSYKAYVKAYVMKDGKKQYVVSSPLMHAYTQGYTKKYTNAKSIKVNKTNVSIKKGKTFKLKAKVKKLKKGKMLMPKKHVQTLRYLSTDTSIATVSKGGKIKGVKTGTCYVYAFAHDGVFKKIKVKVK